MQSFQHTVSKVYSVPLRDQLLSPLATLNVVWSALVALLFALLVKPLEESPVKPVEKETKQAKRCYICLDDDQEDMLILQNCHHTVHRDCIKGQLAAGWTGKRISFGYMSCGECRTPVFHRKIRYALAPHYKLKREVEEICHKKCVEDNVIDNLKTKLRQNEADAKAQCVNTMSCFICNTCDKPFCAGRLNCADDNDIDVSTLNCASCAFKQANAEKKSQKEQKTGENDNWRGKCQIHGYKFAMYKCDSCCSMATYDCRSNHYCTRCHDQAYSEKNYPCPGDDKCPLGIEHPPNVSAVHGEGRNEFVPGFVVGCFRCFMKSDDILPDFEAEPQWEARF